MDPPVLEESSSSSQPPPGRPGDTEDYFVPTMSMHQSSSKADESPDAPPQSKSDSAQSTRSMAAKCSSKKPAPRSGSSLSAGNGKRQNGPHSVAKAPSSRKPRGHHHDDMFRRATKWDIVYLTSSPLVFGCDPFKPLEQLDIGGERNQFWNTLKQSKQRLRVIHKTATTSNIIAAVTGGCRCIHYSGHGYPSYLAFEDAKRIGETHLVHYDLIRKVCEDEDQRIEFVFASACHSEHVGEAFIEAGIQHVVAVNTKFEVTDEAASVFTKHFYNTLLNGRTIQKAFKTAKHAVAAMASSARLDFDKFLLLPRNGKHDVAIFADLGPGELMDDTLETPTNNLPAVVSSFVGRAIDMRHIINQLMDSGVRLLVLTGNSGIGKTATALMVARYFCDRRMFRGGIFFVDVGKLNSKCSSLSEMLLKVLEECGVVKEHRKRMRKHRNRGHSKGRNHRSSHHGPNGHHYHHSNQSSGSASSHSGSSRHSESEDQDSSDEDGMRRSPGTGIMATKHRKSRAKEDVFNIIRNQREMLLVFDGLDQFGEGHHRSYPAHYGSHSKQQRWKPESRKQALSEMEIQDSIQSFLQNVFEKCSIDTKVLVTSSKKLHWFADFTNCISRYYMLRKLKPKDAAKLFSRLCNQFRHTDIVSNHELMRILEYNPKQILRIVQLKHQHHLDSLDKIVKAFLVEQRERDLTTKHEQQEQRQRERKEAEEHEERAQRLKLQRSGPLPVHQQHAAPPFNGGHRVVHHHHHHRHQQGGAAAMQRRKAKQLVMEQYINEGAARVLWSQSDGVDTVSYHEMMGILKAEFVAQTASKRVFEGTDLVEAFLKMGKMDKNGNLHIQHFNALYDWFCGIIQVVKVLLEEWNEQSPCAVAGFISREIAVKQLYPRSPGTFIIRFSNSALRSIVISYRDVNSVEHIKGTLQPQSGRFLFLLKNHNQNECEYSLAVFIQKYLKLSVLYDVRSHKTHSKADVYFGRDHNLQQYKGPMVANSNHSHSTQSSSSQHVQSRHHHTGYSQHSSTTYSGPPPSYM